MTIANLKIPLAKPNVGEPCVGCGFCCKSSLCSAAIWKHKGIAPPCPELFISPDGSRYLCRIIADEIKADKHWHQFNLAVGQGCTCERNPRKKRCAK